MKSNPQKIHWATRPEAIRLFFRGVTLPACIPIALIVGVILSTINQGDILLGGAATTATWIKVGMNFVVPLCVSSYGFLNACRTEQYMPKENAPATCTRHNHCDTAD